MLSKTFPIVMDTGIVSILTIASFLLLAFTMETMGGIHAIPRIDITSISTAGFLFFGTVGFTIVGCRAPHPFWPHLLVHSSVVHTADHRRRDFCAVADYWSLSYHPCRGFRWDGIFCGQTSGSEEHVTQVADSN